MFCPEPSMPRAFSPPLWELWTKFYMAVNIDALRTAQDDCNPLYWRRRIMWRNDQGCLKSCRAFTMWFLCYMQNAVCGGFVWECIFVQCVFVVHKLVERQFFQTPISRKRVAAGSTFPLRLCLLNNVPSQLIMNNISVGFVVPLTFLHLAMIKMPSAHHFSFSLSFYTFHHLFFLTLPPPLLLSVLVSLSLVLIHNSSFPAKS